MRGPQGHPLPHRNPARVSEVGSRWIDRNCCRISGQHDGGPLSYVIRDQDFGDNLHQIGSKGSPCNVGGGFKKTFKKTQTRGKIFTHFDDIIFEMLQKLTIQ